MKHKAKTVIFLIDALSIATLFVILARNGNLQLLNPQGYVAQGQSTLLVMALVLAFCIGIPLILFTLFIVFRYQEGNNQAYTPEWSAGKKLTTAWWSIPACIIFVWAIIGWQSAHAYDPYNPIIAQSKPIEIEVVALRWKWLFIYPQENIATVNYLEIPANTPIDFQLTADNAPMNSFWIPSLGGQIYAMTGMVTQIHLMANKPGDYPGGAAEMSGEGFSGMNFTVKATSNKEYSQWVQSINQSANMLDTNGYNKLVEPSTNNQGKEFSQPNKNLFNSIVAKYMSNGNTIYMSQM